MFQTRAVPELCSDPSGLNPFLIRSMFQTGQSKPRTLFRRLNPFLIRSMFQTEIVATPPRAYSLNPFLIRSMFQT